VGCGMRRRRDGEGGREGGREGGTGTYFAEEAAVFGLLDGDGQVLDVPEEGGREGGREEGKRLLETKGRKEREEGGREGGKEGGRARDLLDVLPEEVEVVLGGVHGRKFGPKILLLLLLPFLPFLSGLAVGSVFSLCV